MGVPLQHLQGLMPRDRGDLHGIQALLKQPTGGLVAQIVKGQTRDASGLADPLEGLGDGVRAHAPYFPIQAARQGAKYRKRSCGQRYPPGRARLGFRDQ